MITVTLVTVALFLAGCTDAAEPTSLPSMDRVSDPQVTAGPVATPPTDVAPTPATEGPRSAVNSDSATEANVLNSLDGYFQAANRASKGDAFEDFRARFVDSCRLCSTQYENFVSAYSQGHFAEGELYASWEATVQDLSGKTALVVTTVETGTIVLRNSAGQILEEFPGEAGLTTVWTLEQGEDGDWVVIDARDLA